MPWYHDLLKNAVVIALIVGAGTYFIGRLFPEEDAD
jgi:hypothetical protein